jgi:DNA-binding SARP family transcriptional activator/ATP/maltotriose-dependent transcriptional regulator MalT
VRGGRGLVLIHRPRLQSRLASAPIALLEAPGGYGKSTAYAQMAAALDVATIRVVLRGRLDTTGVLSSIALGCRRAGLASLADAIDVEDPDATIERFTDRLAAGDRSVLVAVDEVHRAAPRAAAWLATLAGELPATTRLVLAGRRIGPALNALRFSHEATTIGVDELRFDAEETAAVLEAVRHAAPVPGEVAALLAATDGWPAAVVLAAAGGPFPARAGRSISGGPSLLRTLVDGLLETTDPATRGLIESIGELPLLSASVLEPIGGEGALDRSLEAGLPIRFRPDGWGELPDPVRALLPERPLARDVRREIATIYAVGGELADGAALLHRAGDHDGVAALLAAQRREAVERAGLPFLDAVINDAPDKALARHAACLVNLVRAAERQSFLRTAWIDRSERVLTAGTPSRRAIDAEKARAIARAGDLDGALRAADAVLASAGPDEIVTRGRAHLVRALCLLVQDTAGSIADVATQLELAIGLFSLAGERGWEAEAHQVLGFGVHFTTGAIPLAIERLDRALALRPAPDAARATTLTYVAEVLVHAGRLDDAAVALRESSEIGHRLGDGQAIAYAAWSTAQLAGARRDRGAAISALEEAEAHPEGWFDQLAGVDFLSDASITLAKVGDQEGARRYLARSEERAHGTARQGLPLAARARLEATFGDPAAGLAVLEELDRSPLVYQADRWLHLLLRAACTARLGDAEEAAALVRRSQQAASDLGDAGRPAAQEPELLAIALPGAAPAGERSTTMVVLLGRFAVERDGLDASPPPGRPATLVKLLALRGTLTADEAIDQLWPEADIDTGRARLRNLLNRIRQTSGPLVDRLDGALALAAGTAVDAHRFEEEATLALTAPLEERAGLARRALARSTGELLPADLYADWATVPRERLRRRHLALVDLVAEDAIERGDLDEADRLLDSAIGSDPLEEVRYVRLARALLGQGRVRRARRVADQGLAVAAELGAEPGDELRGLLEEFAVQA